MQRRTFAFLAGAFVFVSACSSATPPASEPAPMPAVMAVDPAGRWSVALVAQGQAFDLVMDLTKAGDGLYSGTITSQAFPPTAISGATLTGNRLKFTVVAPTGDNATFDLIIEGNTLTGDWAMPGDGSRVSGRRIQ